MASLSRTWAVTTSFLSSTARLGHGWRVPRDVLQRPGPQPEKLLVLYEFEACPFCRRAREAFTALDLDVLVKPCPKGGQRFRPEAIARGGKAQFPFLVDDNAGLSLYESADIVTHLYARYAAVAPSWQLTGPQMMPLSTLATGFRSGRGLRARPSRAPALPLELWSYDVSPYCRLVREVLTELELQHVCHNISRGSPKRPAFKARAGKEQFPYLSDPNTGTAMFESDAIIDYLERTYAISPR